MNIKVCLVERGINLVKKAQTAIMMLTKHGRAVYHRIDEKPRLVICIGNSVVEWGLEIPVTQVRFLLDALKLIVSAGLENLRYRYEEGTNSKMMISL